MRLFYSGLRKLARRPASWVTVGLLMGLLALIVIAVGATANNPGDASREAENKLLVTFPGTYDRLLGFIAGLGGLFAVIYGAAIAGSEWSWGTLKSVVARGESRVGYLLTSYVSIAAMIGVGLLLTFAVGIVAAILGAHLANVSTSGIGDSATLQALPGRLLRGWFVVVEEGALGFTIATLARSQLAGIGVGIGFYFGETFAGVFLPGVVKYLPFSVANAALATPSTGAAPGGGFGEVAASALPADQALLLVGVWLVGALIVAAFFADRAEISG